MKRIITLSLLLILAITITGCSKKENVMKLKIKESSWSGWSENYKPNEVTKKYEIKVGDVYKSTLTDSLELTIKEINKDNIVVETKENFSDSDDGTINLLHYKKEFTVYFDKETVLITPTMDYGDIYYLQLVK